MEAINLGRILLRQYNKVNSTNYSAKEFFENHFEVFHSPKSEKNFISITNSPFHNNGGKKPKPYEKRMAEYLEKIASGNRTTSIGRDFPAEGESQATRSQVDMRNIDALTTEDIYLAQIGDNLFVNIESYSVGIGHPEVLYEIYQGWLVYRDKILDNTFYNYKGNQCDTWNGIWLLANTEDQSVDMTVNDIVNSYTAKKKDKSGNEKPIVDEHKCLRFESVRWHQFFINLAVKYADESFNINVKLFSDTNKAYGDITVDLKDLRYVYDFLKLHTEITGSKRAYIQKIFESWDIKSFRYILEGDTLEKHCFEPNNFYDIIHNLKQDKKVKQKDIINLKNYYFMILSTPEIIATTDRLSTQLINFAKSKAGMRNRITDVEKLVNSWSVAHFSKNLAEMAKTYEDDFTIDILDNNTIIQLNKDCFNVFISQLKLKFYLSTSKSNKNVKF